MVAYEAAHGTSKKRAARISANGFKIKGGHGRYGSGIYFWKKGYHYINLAVGWFKYADSTNRYPDEKNPICAVIVVELKANENEILDLEDGLLKDRLARLTEARKIKGNDWGKISSLVESFVQIIQSDLGRKFKIVLKKASPPPEEYCPEYPFWVLGWPDCCIVKDVNCITLKSIR
ncbi:MAG: DUF167 domain-containing protein [Syntrophales bacterium]